MSAVVRIRAVTAASSRRSSISFTLLLGIFLTGAISNVAQAQQKSSAVATAASSAAVQSDPLLKALREELDRNKSQLKMDNIPAP
jgi:hypothetical protein